MKLKFFKTLKNALNESRVISPLNEELGCISLLRMLANLCSGIQKKWFMQKLNDAKEIKCKSIYDVFSENEIQRILRRPPQKKGCYFNAYTLCSMFPDKVRYCEGQWDYHGLGIDHAFNKVGEDYVDITAELALEEDVTQNDYIVFADYDYYDVMKIQADNGFYGEIYDTKLRLKFKK